MSGFSLNWFTSIPGILITVGVLLLVAALVIFIVTNKKGKNKEENKEEVIQNPAPDPSIVTNNVSGMAPAFGPSLEQMPPLAQEVPQQSSMQMQPEVNNFSQSAAIPMDSSQISQAPYGMVQTDNQPINNTVVMGNEMPVIQDSNLNNLQQPVVQSDVIDNNVYQQSPDISAMPGVENNQVLSNLEVANAPLENSNVAVPPQPYATEPVVSSSSIDFNTPVVSNINDQMSVNNVEEMPSIPTIMENSQPLEGQPSVESMPVVQQDSEQPQISTITMEANEEVPTIQMPTIANVPSVEQVVPEMQAQQPMPVESDNFSNVVSSASVLQNPSQEKSIYGGVSTVVPNISEPQDVNNTVHQIYGGANPLESTQSVPISQIANTINGGSMSSFENSSEQSSVVQQSVASTPAVNPQVVDTYQAASQVNPQNVVSMQPASAYSATPQPQIPQQSQNSINGSIPINNNFSYQSVAPAPQVQPTNQPLQ